MKGQPEAAKIILEFALRVLGAGGQELGCLFA